MARDVTNAFIAACNATTTDDTFVVLVTVDHDELAEPIRLNNSGQNLVSDTKTYLACPIQVTLSEDSDERPPQARLTMDNIDRTIVAAIRSISTPPSVSLSLVRASAPDTIEALFDGFEMREINYDNLVIEGVLTLERLFSEPAVAYTFTPTHFPGLF